MWLKWSPLACNDFKTLVEMEKILFTIENVGKEKKLVICIISLPHSVSDPFQRQIQSF